MKNSIHARTGRLLAILLAAAVVFSSMAVGVSAYSFSSGQTVSGIGTIKSSSNYVVTNGLEYTKFTFTGTGGNGQTAYTMEFNPNNDALVPMAYQPKPSYGSTVANSYNQAQAEGYTVYGAINGEFFSMASGNYGTLEGMLITNGKIVADSEKRTNPTAQEPTASNLQVMMAMDKDGKMSLVQSRTAYHFYVDGHEKGNAIIGTINKRYNGTNWWDPLCYFDSDAGGKTYTISDCPGIEVVFEKTNDTELVIEGTLQGKVVSVKTNTYGTAFSDNQFVLFAQNSSANYSYLSSLKAGDEVQIYAEETVESSKEIMKNAVTVSSANYPIVVNGQDNIDNIPYIASDIGGSTVHPQRTAIGVKADGSYVYFCSAGRGTSSENTYGLTLRELANVMISLGCVTAVNLDGGGSSTMVAGGETVYAAEGRSVGSSILIVARDSALQSSSEKQALNDLLWEANNTQYSADQWATIEPIAKEAGAILNGANAMTGNYKSLYMQLQEAMGRVVSVKPKEYISLSAQDWSGDDTLLDITNDSSNALVLSNKNGAWPNATYSCRMSVSMSQSLYYDMTINGQANIALDVNGKEYSLCELIAPDSIDAGSGDIRGGGKTFTGVIKLSDLGVTSDMLDENGNLPVTGIRIAVVGSAGDGSKITIRRFEFASPYSKGDVDGSGRSDSTDARIILRYINGKAVLSDAQKTAADVNGDNQINTTDVRYILYSAAGLQV